MEDLPDPYLPGAISLLDQIDKKILVALRDGRTLIGYLRTMDQFANLVLHETIERIHVDNLFGDIPRGIFIIRGENVVLAGEIDVSRGEQPPGLTRVPIEEVLALQKQRLEQRQLVDEARTRALTERGLAAAHQDDSLALGHDE